MACALASRVRPRLGWRAVACPAGRGDGIAVLLAVFLPPEPGPVEAEVGRAASSRSIEPYSTDSMRNARPMKFVNCFTIGAAGPPWAAGEFARRAWPGARTNF